MFVDIDWDAIAEALRTENLIKYFSTTDPMAILGDPRFWVSALLICIVLYFLKFRKVLSFLVGAVILWSACFYILPKNGKLELRDIAVFGSVFVSVLGFWIYMFLLRSD